MTLLSYNYPVSCSGLSLPDICPNFNRYPPLKYLGLSAGKFAEYSGNTSGSINKFFKAMPPAAGSCTNNSVTSGTSLIENNKLKCKSKDNKDDDSENKHKVEETPSSDNDQTTNKPSVRVSFFEKYFKNQPNKIIRQSSPKKCVNQETITKREKSESLVTAPPFSLADNESYSSKRIVTDCNLITKDNKNEGDKNTNEETWISPSEIFPDLENIDESLIDILPSPLQRQISQLRNAKSNSLAECRVQKDCNLNNKFRMSTESDCAPTTVDTVADVHNHCGNKNVASISSKHIIHRRLIKTNIKYEEDLMEFEDDFIETSPDLFESETHEGNREEAECKIYDACPHCKKSVLVSELQEHLDHHMAMQLQEQWSKESQPNRTVVPSKVKPSKTATVLSDKKKRGRPSKKDSVQPKKSKTIMSFFSRT